MSEYRRVTGSPKTLGIGCATFFTLLFLVIFLVAPNTFGYWFHVVDATEIGVKTVYGDWQEILSPGQYTDIFAMGADITNVNISGIQFEVNDPQVLLAGNSQGQIEEWIGVTVSGTVFRPGFVPRGDVSQLTEALWRDNRNIYLNDDALRAVMDSLSKQAMKVCVGSRNLVSATVGSERNDLAVCIDEALTELAFERALDVQNVTVPNITLRPETEQSIAQISLSNRDAQLAIAQETLVVAQGNQQEAQIRANIQVTAAAQQEQFSAQATSAALEQTAIAAEFQVEAAQATNDASQLLYEQAQAQIQLQIALLDAQSATANAERIAYLYQTYPAYANVIIYEAYAAGLEGVDKVFYIPAGTETLNLIGGQLHDQNGNIVPVVPVTDGGIVPTPAAP